MGARARAVFRARPGGVGDIDVAYDGRCRPRSAPTVRAHGPRPRSAPTVRAARGIRPRGAARCRVRCGTCRVIVTCSPTSSACGARWTSCSAMCSIAGSRCAAVADSRPRSTCTTWPIRRAPSSRPTLPESIPGELELEVRGRELVLSGLRRPDSAEGRAYQQLEIEHGPFRRVVALGVEVDRGRREGGLPGRHARSRDACPDEPAAVAQRADHQAAEGSAVIEIETSGGPNGHDVPVGGEIVLPRFLPVLPLRDSVTYPDTLTPLAVGQERSVELVNDILAADRMLVMVACQERRARDTRTRGSVRRRRRRRGRADAQGPRRNAACARPGRPARKDRIVGRRPEAVPDRLRHRAARRRQGGPRAHRADAQRAADLLAHHRGGPVSARGARHGGRQRRRPVGAQPSDRRDRCGCPPRRSRSCSRRSTSPSACGGCPSCSHARLEVVAIGTPHPDPGPVGDRRGPARVHPAPAAARRSRRSSASATRPRPRSRTCASSSRRASCPRTSRKIAERELSRLEKLPQAAAEHGVIRTYLEWIVVAAVERVDRGQPRPRPRARGPRRGPLRHREGQGPHPRVPRRTPLKPDAQRIDPVPRRSPGRRQDLARSLDRERAGAQVRAHLGRRPARRGRDPRSPPHLHRRDAGRDHPGTARRGLQQPAVHDRRDRQDGRGLPRRSRQRDARGARSRAERDLPRPLPRPSVRPLAGDVHHHGEHPRHRSRPAARPHGGDRARRLHRGGEARDRQALPGAAPESIATASSARTSRSPTRA